MKPTALLALALLAFPIRAAAQEEAAPEAAEPPAGEPSSGDGPNIPAPPPPTQMEQKPEGSEDSAAAEGGEGEKSGGYSTDRTVTLDDARSNIASIVQAFIERRSPNGFWPLRDKKTKLVRQLKLVGIEEKRTRKAGVNKYAVPALLKDVRTAEQLSSTWVVDFGGAEWKVVAMRLKSPPPPKTEAPAKTDAAPAKTPPAAAAKPKSGGGPIAAPGGGR